MHCLPNSTRALRISGRGRKMCLNLADSASDPRQQSRLEEMYGRMAAAAEGIEEQRSRLRALRNELAAAKPVSP